MYFVFNHHLHKRSRKLAFSTNNLKLCTPKNIKQVAVNNPLGKCNKTKMSLNAHNYDYVAKCFFNSDVRHLIKVLPTNVDPQ